MGLVKRIAATLGPLAAMGLAAAAHAAPAPVTPPSEPPPLIDTQVVPVGPGGPRFVANPDLVERASRRRGAAVYAGPAFWFDLGGDVEAIGRDVGVRRPPGPMLPGFELGGWFAPQPAVRLGAWLHWLQDERREAYAATIAGDEERGVAARVRGGGVSAAWRWQQRALGGSLGGGLGLGEAGFVVSHRRLSSPGSWSDYARGLRDATRLVDGWTRAFSASGPLARADATLDYGVTDWFRVGIGGSFAMHYLPAGNWVDDLSGGQLGAPPTVSMRAAAARLELTAGRFPR